MRKLVILVLILSLHSMFLSADIELQLDPSEPNLRLPVHSQSVRGLDSYQHPAFKNDSNVSVTIDDFDQDPQLNHLGGISGSWEKDPMDQDEFCTQSIVYDDKSGKQNKVLKLTYDVDSKKPAYNGFWTRLNGIDLTAFKELKFWIKGDAVEGFTKQFKIELKNSSSTGYFYVQGVENKWKEITIPLKDFTGLKALSKVDELTIVFEDRIAKPKTGTLYLDDLSFTGPKEWVEKLKVKARQELIQELNLMLEQKDDIFLRLLEKKIYLYFENEMDSSTGLIKDRNTPGAPASIAATGFGLAAYCIAEKNGWISRVEAYQKILKILRTLEENAAKEHGFFYHFLDPKTAKRWTDSEVSSIDTALLVSGVLIAGQYFKDTEINDRADRIYQAIEWDWMKNPASNLIYMQWKPGTGFNGSPVWDMSAEERILYLLAMGSPTHPLSSNTWKEWKREKYSNGTAQFMVDPGHSLFTNLYSESLVDFRGKSDDYMNYWENSRQSALANREFCIQHQSEFKGYGPYGWGISASDGPYGYRAYGAKEGAHDGTLAPYAMIASLPLAPEFVLPSIRHMLTHYGEKIWGSYGPTSAYNVDKNWFSKEYIGIDQGIMLLMIENYRSEFSWQYLMKEPSIQLAMGKARFLPDKSFLLTKRDSKSDTKEL